MNDASSTVNPDDLLFADFLLDFEQRGQTAVADCGKRLPHLVPRIQEWLGLQNAIEESRPAEAEQVPTELGNYRILRLLHRGGMGEIYLAEEKYLENQGRWPRRVAVKVIRQGRESTQARSRFLREQRVLAHLHQTHIVSLFHAAEQGRWQYFVMPYIDGAALDKVVQCARAHETGSHRGQTPTLASLASELAPNKEDAPAEVAVPQPAGRAAVPEGAAADGGRKALSTWGSQPGAALSEGAAADDGSTRAAAPAAITYRLSPAYFRSVAETMADAAEAVHHVHKTGLLHRDLKPSNIMVDRSGACCVIDFGLAGYLNEVPDAKSGNSSLDLGPEPISATGILGTPVYMAPEQWTKSKPDVASDVWSLGSTLYELLTLRRAFDGKTHLEIQTKVLKEEPAPPRKLVTNVPPDLAAICRKALHKKPGDRYASAGEMTEDLRRWLRLEPTVARPARTPRRMWLWSRRNPGGALALVMAVFALLLGAGWVVSEMKDRIAITEREKDILNRQLKIQEAQRLRMSSPRRPGWSSDVITLLEKAAIKGVDDSLRNEAATSLIGLDVVLAKEFKEGGASALAFDTAGAKLLMGAHPKGRGFGGKEIAAKPIRIWDKATDQVRKTTIFLQGPVTFDAKNRPLALTAKDQDPSTLLLWDLDKEQPQREFALPPKVKGQPKELALSTNCAKVAAIVALKDGNTMVVVWDAVTGNVLHQKETKRSKALALSPDGTLLATGDNDGCIQVWSFDKAAPTAPLKCGRLAVTALTFGPNPRKALEENPWVLASGDAGGTILIRDVAGLLPPTKCPGSHHAIYALAFNRDGTRLASGGRGRPRLWNASTGELLVELDIHDFVTAVAFSPDGTRLAMADPMAPFSYLCVRVWLLESGRGLQTLDGLSGQIACVEFSHDGSGLAALSHLWEIGVWDVKTGRLMQVFPAPPGYFADNAAIALSRDNRYLAYTSGTNAVMWDLQTGKSQTWPLPRGFVDRLAFHPVLGKFISFRAETEKDRRVGRLREWNPAGLKDIGVIKDFKKSITQAALARNGSVVLVKGSDGDDKGETTQVRAYVLPGAKEIWNGPGNAESLSPDGKFHLYNAVEDGLAVRPKLLNLGLGKTEDWPIPHQFLGPEGNYAASHGGEVRPGRPVALNVYRRDAKIPLVVFSTNAASNVQFNLAGTQFAWGTTDGTVIVCDLAETQRRLAAVRLGWDR